MAKTHGLYKAPQNYYQEIRDVLRAAAQIVVEHDLYKPSVIRVHIEKLKDNPMFIACAEKDMPRTVSTFRFLKRTYLFAQRQLETAKVVAVSIPYVRRTPKEAEWICNSYLLAGDILQIGSVPKGDERLENRVLELHFYHSLERGKYRSGTPNEPDIECEFVISQRQGGDLKALRSQLGIESVAIITPHSHRGVFRAEKVDSLSMKAAYVLSDNFTKPIRIYEPEVLALTKVKRQVRAPVYFVGFFFFSLLELVIGFPEEEAYMAAIFPPRYAAIYTDIAHFARPAQYWLQMALIWLLFPITLVVLLLGLAVSKSIQLTRNNTHIAKRYARSVLTSSLPLAGRTCKRVWKLARGGLFSMVLGIYAAVQAFCTVCHFFVGMPKGTFGFLSSLERSSWLVITLGLWMAVAEYNVIVNTEQGSANTGQHDF